MNISLRCRHEAEQRISEWASSLEKMSREGLSNEEGPIPSVSWRVKSDYSIWRKIEKARLLDPSIDQNINDFFGIRLITSHEGMLFSALQIIERWSTKLGLMKVNMEDNFSSGGEAGYRAIHLDFALPSNFLQFSEMGLGLEVQVTTYLQQFHSAVSHQLFYNAEKSNLTDDVADKLSLLSNSLHSIDLDISRIFSKIRGKASSF
ncbi:hypothetical protein [Devosia riboflavina]